MNGIMVLVAYAVLMIVATIVFAKRDKDSDSFYVGNRNMGTVSSAMSIAATWIWAPALFTSAEKAYLNGVPGLFWFLVPNILCLLIFIPFAKRIRKEMPNGITLSGYMHEKYRSEKVKGVYLFQLTMLTVLSTAVQLLAGGKILSVATGLPLWVMTIVLAVIAFSYSQIWMCSSILRISGISQNDTGISSCRCQPLLLQRTLSTYTRDSSREIRR